MSSVVIPPLLLYAFGVVLMILGGLRAFHLGYKRRPAAEGPDGEAATDDENADEEADANRRPGRSGWARSEGGGYKRHLTMGLLWVAMGLFLVLSTALNS